MAEAAYSLLEDFSARQEYNRRASRFLVFVFFLVFLLVGAAVDFLYFDVSAGSGVPVATLVALAIATAIALSSYYGGSELILSSLGAERLNLTVPEQRELQNIVTEMALASGLPMPKTYVIFDPSPNAFATGRDELHASLCVTSGLLVLLNREETQGVVAHELAHIRDRDTRLMLLVTVLLGGVVLLSDWAQRSFYSSRTRDRFAGKGALLTLPLLLLIVVAPLFSRLLAMAVSRQREYLADAASAEYTRNPLGLAHALEKIRDAAMPFSRATRGTAHLFLVNPLSRRVDDREGALADLLSTHPPLASRIMLLYRMAGVQKMTAS
ncbi:MAG TPA: M48 family metallopeptidase [Candidatus Binatia bacterium]|jgi:heat shock protein HtpX